MAVKRIIMKIKKIIFDKNYRLNIKIKYGWYNHLDDEAFLKKIFFKKIGTKLNLDNPKTFNEKLQWLKLHDQKDIYTTMVDKYTAKEFVEKAIGSEYVIKTLSVYNTFDEINFDSLPNRFVIKCTHDSGGLVIVKDKTKLNKHAAKQIINKSLRRNYFFAGREWPYKNIKPRIIIEEYIEDDNDPELKDYKFMCFNGKVKCSFVCSGRNSENGLHVDFYDLDWNKMPFKRHYPNSDITIDKPYNYDLMIELAETLSKGIPFVRVDFYEVNNKVYFGELTFYPGSGFEEFTPVEYDGILGEWIKI